MNTLSNITNAIIHDINSQTIDELVAIGYERDHAVKVVTEFDFDLAASVESNPVDDQNAF